jgi:branched-chain amino acid transport system permease protein
MELSPQLVAQVLLNGLSLSAIYVFVAMGFTLLFGIMKVVNFAHGAFVVLGGYALYHLLSDLHLNYFLALPLAAIIVTAGALVLERFVYRFFYQRMFQSMIGLLGLNMVLVQVSVLVWTPNERSIPIALDGIIEIGGVVLPEDRLFIMALAVVVLGLFWYFVRFTRNGLAMRAAAADLEVAQAQGIPTRRIYLIAFSVAIALTSLGGALYSQIYSLSPFMGERALTMAFITVILGGMGSIAGAALGSLILGFSDSVLATFFGATTANFATFGLVLLLLLVRPWGLLGTPDE